MRKKDEPEVHRKLRRAPGKTQHPSQAIDYLTELEHHAAELLANIAECMP